ncbi:DNA repair protein rad52 [Blyttiomyces sp. JEL0837]|nr:DNA repair protein rad52 [Blyttiomyces sp. JEL0837]
MPEVINGNNTSNHHMMMNNNSITSQFGCRPFLSDERDTIARNLAKNLGPENLATRGGPGGSKLTYLEGYRAIAIANEIFGFDGWSHSITDTCVDYCDVTREGNAVSVGISVIVRVTLKNGTYHEDIGYGSIDNAKGKGAAFQKAKKEAVTDALKRAFKSFGNAMGNCVYDKEFLKKCTRMPKAQAIPMTPESLYHGAGYVQPMAKGAPTGGMAQGGPSGTVFGGAGEMFNEGDSMMFAGDIETMDPRFLTDAGPQSHGPDPRPFPQGPQQNAGQQNSNYGRTNQNGGPSTSAGNHNVNNNNSNNNNSNRPPQQPPQYQNPPSSSSPSGAGASNNQMRPPQNNPPPQNGIGSNGAGNQNNNFGNGPGMNKNNMNQGMGGSATPRGPGPSFGVGTAGVSNNNNNNGMNGHNRNGPNNNNNNNNSGPNNSNNNHSGPNNNNSINAHSNGNNNGLNNSNNNSNNNGLNNNNNNGSSMNNQPNRENIRPMNVPANNPGSTSTSPHNPNSGNLQAKPAAPAGPSPFVVPQPPHQQQQVRPGLPGNSGPGIGGPGGNVGIGIGGSSSSSTSMGGMNQQQGGSMGMNSGNNNHVRGSSVNVPLPSPGGNGMKRSFSTGGAPPPALNLAPASGSGFNPQARPPHQQPLNPNPGAPNFQAPTGGNNAPYQYPNPVVKRSRVDG